MNVSTGSERRERPSRAAAPTKNMRDPDSSEDDAPSKKTRKILLKTKVSTQPVTQASTQPVTPASSQAAVTPQPTSSSIPEIQALYECIYSVESRMARDAAELSNAQKDFVIIEKAFEKVMGDKEVDTSEASFAHPTDDNQDPQENQKLRQENRQLKTRLSEEKYRVAELQRQSLPLSQFKVMDCDVVSEWRRIAFDIRNFVYQVLTKKPHGEKTPQGANFKVVEALKKIQKKDIRTAPYHFQRYIWMRLVEDIFQAGKATWGGSAGQAFHRYCLDISEIDFDEMKKLSPYKASQADLLTTFFNDDNRAAARSIVREMAMTLELFMDPEEKAKKGELGPIQCLKNIVGRAVELNGKFLKSKAFYLTNWITGDFEWDDLDIRHYAGDPEGEHELDIEISPRLRKIGNADGRHFDQAMELCQPMVTVYRR